MVDGKSGIYKLSDDAIEQGFFRLAEREQAIGSNRLSFTRITDSLLETAKLGDNTYGGTLLQLSEEQVRSAGISSPSYRNSRLLQITDASLSIENDDAFTTRIEKIFNDLGSGFSSRKIQKIGAAEGVNYSSFQDVVDDFIGAGLEEGEARSRAAFYVSGQALKGSKGAGYGAGDHVAAAVQVAFAEMKSRIENTAVADPGALGNYINTLAATSSSNKQFDHIIRGVRNGHFKGTLEKVLDPTRKQELIDLLNQQYLIHNPEGAIDFSIGGKGKVSFTQSADDLVELMKQFGSQDLIDEASLEKTAYRALFNLTRDDNFNYGEGLETFEKWEAAYLDNTHAMHKKAVDAVSVRLENVRVNALFEQGAMMGKMRALYHAGLLDENELNRLGMDAFVGLSRLGDKDMAYMLRGIVHGAEEIVNFFGEDAIEGFQSGSIRRSGTLTGDLGFYQYYKKMLDEVLADPEKPKTKGLGFKMFRSDGEYSLRLKGTLAEKEFGLDQVQKIGQELANTTRAQQARLRASRAHTTRMLNANAEISKDALAGDTVRDIVNLIREQSQDEYSEFTRYNRIQSAIAQKGAAGQSIRNVETFLKKEMKLADDDELLKLLKGFNVGEDSKMLFVEDYLSWKSKQAAESISQRVYDRIANAINRPDMPVDLERTLKALYIKAHDLGQTSVVRDPDAHQVGSMIKAIFENESFFSENGRERLDLAYAEAKRRLDLSTVSQDVKDAERRVKTILDHVDAVASNRNFEQNAQYLDESDIEARINLAFRQEGLVSYETGSSVGKGMTITSDFDIAYPDSIEMSLGPPKSRMNLDDLINLTLSAENLSDQETQLLRDYFYATTSDDTEAAYSLIRSRLNAGNATLSENARIVQENQTEEYISTLKNISARNAILAAKENEQAAEILQKFTQPLDDRIQSISGFIDSLPAFQEIADIGLTDEIIPQAKYTRITDFIRQKFPLEGQGLGSMVRNNAGRILIGAAAVAGGAFLYSQHKNKDLSQSDLSPPLLPGGSPYEMPATETVQYPNFSSTNMSGDLDGSYQLQVSGSEEQMRRFIEEARAVDPSTNAELRSAIANPAKNQYSDIASAY